MGGTNTGSTVLHRLVRDGELAKVMSDHLSLDLNLKQAEWDKNSDFNLNLISLIGLKIEISRPSPIKIEITENKTGSRMSFKTGHGKYRAIRLPD